MKKLLMRSTRCDRCGASMVFRLRPAHESPIPQMELACSKDYVGNSVRYLSPVETALVNLIQEKAEEVAPLSMIKNLQDCCLSAIKNLQDRCDKLEAAEKATEDYNLGHETEVLMQDGSLRKVRYIIPGNLVAKLDGEQPIIKVEPEVSTDAEKITTNCEHPKLADKLGHLIFADKASQSWWKGLSDCHQKSLMDCGLWCRLELHAPNLGPAVALHPEREAEIQNAKLGKAGAAGFLPVMTENSTIQTLAEEITHYFATNVERGCWWNYMHKDQKDTILVEVTEILKKATTQP